MSGYTQAPETGLFHGLRRWLMRRRIERILRSCGWPRVHHRIFEGDVDVECVRYADYYVELYNDPNEVI